jgi:PII-like signaling protein
MQLPTQPASLLRIHVCEGDKYGGKLLYEAIVERCLELGLAGASVFRCIEGFGDTAGIHRKRLLAKDQPVMIVIIDLDEKIGRALPVLEMMVDSGMIATSSVQMRHIQRASSSPA